MGVPKLWDLIKDTSETRSLMHLAVVDGFEKNVSGKRGYRIGIDASIWFFHAKSSREGENPELRLIFFRLARLLAQPILPLFVFDGKQRPSWKRNKEISRKPHWMVQGCKDMILAFGFEWKQAPGEAEAELAYLNRIGEIDAVLSDDVDNFLFGAKTVIRNPGRGLSGNIGNPALNSQGKDDGCHVRIFSANVIASDPKLHLTRAGFVLIGLMSGGDYERDGLEGSAVDGCGVDTAHALARCGFGDSIIDAFTSLSPADFHNFLQTWRDDLRKELCTNSQGFLKSRRATLSTKISDAFPNLDVLKAYVSPVTSETVSNAAKLPLPDRWRREHSLARLASFCESKFEWGTKVQIPKRFASLLWGGALIRIIRRAALDLDEGIVEPGRRVISSEAPMPLPGVASQGPPITPKKQKNGNRGDPRGGGNIGTPSKMITKYFTGLVLESPGPQNVDNEDDLDQDSKYLIKEITGKSASHPSTDHMLEYRVEIDPTQLIALALSGIRGDREEEPDSDNAGDYGDESSSLNPKEPDEDKIVRGPRFWVPASMLRMVEPDLVATYEASRASKGAKKKARKRDRARSKGSNRARDRASVLSDSEQEPWEDHSPTRGKSKTSLPSNLSPIMSDDNTGLGTMRVNHAHVGSGHDDPFSATSPLVLSTRQHSSSTSHQRGSDPGTRSVATSRAHTSTKSVATRSAVHSQTQGFWEELFPSTGSQSYTRPPPVSNPESHSKVSPRKRIFISGTGTHDTRTADFEAIFEVTEPSGLTSLQKSPRKSRRQSGPRDSIKRPGRNGPRQLPAGLDPLSDSSSHGSNANARPDSPSPSQTMTQTALPSVLLPSVQTTVSSTSRTSGATVGEIIEISSDSDTDVPRPKSQSSFLTQTLAPRTLISRPDDLPSRQTTNSSSRVRTRDPASGKKIVTSADNAPTDKNLPQSMTRTVHHAIIDLSSP